MSFINPTLPLAEMNKKTLAEIIHCSSCVEGRMLSVCVCVEGGICEKLLLKCVYLMFISVIAELKQASGNAFSCNYGSGVNLK